MGKVIEGQLKGRGNKVAIIVSRFNEIITNRLYDGCYQELIKQGVAAKNIITVWVPGAFELPIIAKKYAQKKDVKAVICLGAVIRGETFHFDIVALGAAQGVLQASLMTDKPIVLGLLTTDTLDQAYKRTDEKGSHKGVDAAHTALEMAHVLKQI